MSGKIAEIITSGRAPGVVTGAVDPQSSFAAVPRAIKQLERGEGGFKRPMGARDISRHFGFSTDLIKRKWLETNPKAFGFLLALLWSVCGALGGDITPGQYFQDRQTVFASDLNNAIGGATVNPVFISRQQIDYAPLLSDYVIIYSNGQLYKVTLLNLVNNSQSFIQLPSGVPNYTNQFDLFSFYSASGTNIQSVTFPNLVFAIATNINPVVWMQFEPTNNPGNTNLPVLANWPGVFSGLYPTNIPFFLAWGTNANGTPYQVSFLTLETSAAADLGTNLFFPYEFSYVYQPWTLFGTNTVSPYTNAWGYTTNFPITALFTTNAAGTNISTPTILDSDTIPLLEGGQGTNTVATAQALYQYMTNKNALPPYTQARIQFSGIPDNISLTNMSITTGIITNADDWTNFLTPTAVSFLGKAAQVLTLPPITSNLLYYALVTNTTPIGFQLYTNRNDALNRTNQILGDGVSPSRTGSMYWLTNFTSYNADVIQTSAGTGPNTAVYDVYFLTNAANALYYVSGMSMREGNGGNMVDFSSDNIITTNRFRIITIHDQGTATVSPLVHILVNPQ